MELYEISELRLAMANGSCPLPHLECLQARELSVGTSYRVGVYSSREASSRYPERMGKQQMKDGGGEKGAKRRDGEGAAPIIKKGHWLW